MDGIAPVSQAPTAEPKPDLSKTTLVVLVLLTLVISVIGTWSVLNEVNSVKLVKQATPQTAHVSLNLENPDAASQTAGATGHVTFNLQQ